MSLMPMPWTALLDMQPQRSHQIAWFVYGWIEREHRPERDRLCALVDASAWAVGGSGSRPLRRALGTRGPQVEPQVLVHDSDRAEDQIGRGSRRQPESLS
jgi:hypothetical protein